jgi:hypothetical protein
MIKMLQTQIVLKSTQFNNMNKFIEDLQARQGLDKTESRQDPPNKAIENENAILAAPPSEPIFDIPKKSDPVYML